MLLCIRGKKTSSTRHYL